MNPSGFQNSQILIQVTFQVVGAGKLFRAKNRPGLRDPRCTFANLAAARAHPVARRLAIFRLPPLEKRMISNLQDSIQNDIMDLAVTLALEDNSFSDEETDEDYDETLAALDDREDKARALVAIQLQLTIYCTQLKINASKSFEFFHHDSNHPQHPVKKQMMKNLKSLGCFGNGASVGMLAKKENALEKKDGTDYYNRKGPYGISTLLISDIQKKIQYLSLYWMAWMSITPRLLLRWPILIQRISLISQMNSKLSNRIYQAYKFQSLKGLRLPVYDLRDFNRINPGINACVVLHKFLLKGSDVC
ncbi:hypothetical protein VP01_444g7 [Puccinia sorghi]|uniref:DDE Tnp4 domain-containing protein n=1 Tax=Puccinia sorghi TaxID=27349 RepID=A0A0L6URE3_9BASI|nr:hypothetical protein VP01_444g7 [Puccinia sorghi]